MGGRERTNSLDYINIIGTFFVFGTQYMCEKKSTYIYIYRPFCADDDAFFHAWFASLLFSLSRAQVTTITDLAKQWSGGDHDITNQDIPTKEALEDLRVNRFVCYRGLQKTLLVSRFFCSSGHCCANLVDELQ